MTAQGLYTLLEAFGLDHSQRQDSGLPQLCLFPLCSLDQQQAGNLQSLDDGSKIQWKLEEEQKVLIL